jgi:predicted DNA-binding transcriptional regulator AlpA
MKLPTFPLGIGTNPGGESMEAKPPRKPRATKPRPAPLFVNHREIARDMGVSTRTVMRWVDRAEFPLPHSVRGILRLWLRSDYQYYVKTGRWPAGTEFRAKH